MRIITSIFRYPGGKTRPHIRSRILSLAPEFDEYREAFVGGGGIFFAIDPRKKRWINDKNRHLIGVYEALRDRPKRFIELCHAIEPMKSGEPEVYPTENSNGKKYNARLKNHFDLFAKSTQCDQALRYFFVNRTVWGGRVNYDAPSRMYFSNPEGWNIVKTRKLTDAAEILKGVKVTGGDYADLLNTPGENVWVYCDPPYMKDTELACMSKLYKFGFTLDDHKRFAEAVFNCKHRVCISYDDHPKIREMFADLHILEEEWLYCGTSSAPGANKTKEMGKELLITNYPVKRHKKSMVSFDED